MRTALALLCGCTLLATVYLSVSLAVLRPPRANYQQWAVIAATIVAVGVLTLAALVVDRSARLAAAVTAGGIVLAVIGVVSVYRTVSGDHFEGYALVLGSALVVQGALAALWGLTPLTLRPGV
jgi:hypothetical protein